MITVPTAEEKKGLFGTHFFSLRGLFCGPAAEGITAPSRGLTQAEQQSSKGFFLQPPAALRQHIPNQASRPQGATALPGRE